jgi:pSer/pThr/pTyr-binding forkhead associated (FHA) protein
MLDFVLRISHYALPLLAVAVLALCLSALLKRRAPSLGEARLINTVNGDSFPLVSRETSIGRHKNCDIILNYPTVSRLGAIIVCTKNGWYITGVNSEADVLINGKKPEKKELLKTGDKITFGSISLIFDNKQG